MRCVCCNRVLNDYESTLRHAETNQFTDTCIKCLNGLGVPVSGRPDLNPFDELDDDFYEENYIEEDDNEYLARS